MYRVPKILPHFLTEFCALFTLKAYYCHLNIKWRFSITKKWCHMHWKFQEVYALVYLKQQMLRFTKLYSNLSCTGIILLIAIFPTKLHFPTKMYMLKYTRVSINNFLILFKIYVCPSFQC